MYRLTLFLILSDKPLTNFMVRNFLANYRVFQRTITNTHEHVQVKYLANGSYSKFLQGF